MAIFICSGVIYLDKYSPELSIIFLKYPVCNTKTLTTTILSKYNKYWKTAFGRDI